MVDRVPAAPRIFISSKDTEEVRLAYKKSQKNTVIGKLGFMVAIFFFLLTFFKFFLYEKSPEREIIYPSFACELGHFLVVIVVMLLMVLLTGMYCC